MKPWPYPFWIAHRGGGALAPENTLPAFRTGLRWGWRMMECDVKLSADGVPYLMHDDTLDRTTNSTGPANAAPWSELRALDAGAWHSDWFRHAAPAGLSEVAALVQEEGACVNLEIKPMPGQGGVTGERVAIEATRLWAHAPVAPLLSSFDLDALAAAKAAAPHLPRALLLDREADAGIPRALALACDAIVPHHRLVNADLMEAARRSQLRVLSYTVNHKKDALRLVALGVDGLITDAITQFNPAADPRLAAGLQLR